MKMEVDLLPTPTLDLDAVGRLAALTAQIEVLLAARREGGAMPPVTYQGVRLPASYRGLAEDLIEDREAAIRQLGDHGEGDAVMRQMMGAMRRVRG